MAMTDSVFYYLCGFCYNAPPRLPESSVCLIAGGPAGLSIVIGDINSQLCKHWLHNSDSTFVWLPLIHRAL